MVALLVLGQVQVHVEGELPCSEKELLEAVALRVEVSTAAMDRATVRGGDGNVEVEFNGQVRRVDVGRSTDVAAARRIALALADLVRGPVTVGLPPLEEAPPPAPPAVEAITTTIAPPLPNVSVEPRAPVVLFGSSFHLGAGDTFDRPRFALSLDASIAIVDPLRAVFSIGAAFVPPASRDEFTVRYAAGLAKAGLGLRFPEAAWEVRALGGAETYIVDGDGVERQIDTLPLIEAAFSYAFAIGDAVEIPIGASVAGYLLRKRFEVIGQEILTTERVVFAIAGGVVWGSR
jgi:hypothetical protein